MIGATGQDGSYLCELLVEKGYEVTGVTRRPPSEPLPNLERVRDRIRLVQADLADFERLGREISEWAPDEIYNFASASFGPNAWSDPAGAAELGAVALARLLEAIRVDAPKARFFQASSAWVFGRPVQTPQNERTPYAPVEPYGAAKAYGDFLVRAYRDGHGIFACSGILFNHDSPLRPERFVTRKVAIAAAEIAAGKRSRVSFGNLQLSRDWGYAPEYVEAIWMMMQRDQADDFVIATGESHTIEELVGAAFAEVGLDWRNHVDIDRSLFRPTDIAYSRGNPEKARRILGWQAKTKFRDLVKILVDAER